ncbi:MAG TPA: DUF6134 family protein [Dehalococcoidia bacterium]|nr:DUF6134 family protein [Dehalococcoidia bacterium]
MREGVVVGQHRVTFQQDNERLVVRSELKIEVKVLSVTAYRYQQTRSEVWRGPKLIALASVADDDGTPYGLGRPGRNPGDLGRKELDSARRQRAGQLLDCIHGNREGSLN